MQEEAVKLVLSIAHYTQGKIHPGVTLSSFMEAYGAVQQLIPAHPGEAATYTFKLDA